ncbi:UDP-N-acetylmuramate dehydrogenase [Gammaproteobacteria bacterium]|nr:UDP-N-acetylmuramate dehydrogenase [Gammaproteobacteria bacterium]
MIVKENYPIENSLNLKSQAKYFIELSEETDFNELSLFLKKYELPVLILGEGTNLVPPIFFDGIILKPLFPSIKLSLDNTLISAGASVNWHSFVTFCIKNNINGFENLSLIPGSVGASPIQNIGAYGADVSNLIESVDCYDFVLNKLLKLTAAECDFSYRHSGLKKSSLIVMKINFYANLPVELNLEYKSINLFIKENNINPNDISLTKMSDIICKIRTSVLPDPSITPNAGSFFKNPIVELDSISTEFFNLEDLIIWEYSSTHVKVGAAKLIDLIKDKIQSLDNVGLYKNHSLVVTTNGNSSQDEVLSYASNIQALVKENFNIDLYIEPTVVI